MYMFFDNVKLKDIKFPNGAFKWNNKKNPIVSLGLLQNQTWLKTS